MKAILILGLLMILAVWLAWQQTANDITVPPLVKPAADASKKRDLKKNCGCCRKAAEQTRQMREDLKWAKAAITTYGYEEGMRRIRAKSPILAKMMQHSIEKRARGSLPWIPETSP